VQKWLRTLSVGTEFAVVILGGFGFFIFTSYVGHFRPSAAHRITSAQLEFLALYELIVGAALAVFLAARGWSLKRIGLAPTFLDTAIGLLFVAAIYVAWMAVWILIASFLPSPNATARDLAFTSPGVGFWTAASTSFVNGMFEELFVCGYVIAALKDRAPPWTAINISVGIRLLYHLYLGPLGMIFVVLVGVSFGYWYAQRGRLWPLIVAHAVLDYMAM
jgi:membrane protease YdiL (CAAX protease family)